MNIQEAEQFIKKQKWIFAKTYAKTAPHEYVMVFPNSNLEFKEQALKFNALIEKEGYNRKFYSRTFRYINIDGYRYWTADCGNGSWSINRCPEDDLTGLR